MLNVLYLIVIIICGSGQSITKKSYTQKVGDRGIYFFNAVLSTSALVFFVATATNLHFDFSYIPYSVGFAISYITASLFMVLAIAYGSLSLTSLFVSYSLMIPTIYGLVIGDTVSPGFIPGMLFLFISLFLTNKVDCVPRAFFCR